MVYFMCNLTTQCWEVSGATGSLRTVTATLALLIHLSTNIVSAGSIVTSVELGKPLALPVLVHSAADLVRVRPNHGGVVANVCAELERLDPLVGEQFNLVIPIRYGTGPIGRSRTLSLLVDVQVLSHAEAL